MWAPAGVPDPLHATGHADAFDDRFPTQPVAVGRQQVGLVLDSRASHREPARTAVRPAPRAIVVASVVVAAVVVAAVVVAAIVGALTYQSRATSTSWTTHGPSGGSVPAPSHRAVGKADGVVPDGVTVFDDDVPAVSGLDPDLLGALRRAATDAAHHGVAFVINSGWRSREYQDELLREAVSTYGSRQQAARWVATADTSAHVSGKAIDIGHAGAVAWLSHHGAAYGLCQIYRNEPWHFELRPRAADRGCPPRYADPTHDPRMQQ
jgi:hypothetical protein